MGNTINPDDVKNGDQKAGSATAKCNKNCDKCLCKKYGVMFWFVDDENIPYSNKKYIASFKNGEKRYGVTDKDGRTEAFYCVQKEEVSVQLLNIRERLFE